MRMRVALIALAFILLAPTAQSRDDKYMLPIDEAMKSQVFKSKLDPNIKMYFGKQGHPSVAKTFGSFSTNKKTNAFNKTDEEACEWAFLSALISLQNRVRREGGNAVVGIASYYKKDVVLDSDRYECHVGNIIAGVALTGEVVKLQ